MNDKERHRRRRAQKDLRRRRAHAAVIAELRDRVRRRLFGRPLSLRTRRQLRSYYLRNEGKCRLGHNNWYRRWGIKYRLRLEKRLRRTGEREQLAELAYLGAKALMKRSLRTQSRRLPYFWLRRLFRGRAAGGRGRRGRRGGRGRQ